MNRGLLAVLSSAVFAGLQACGEGPPSGYSVPTPTEQTPRICPGQVRSVTATYPASTTGTAALANIQLQEGREPVSTSVVWTVQSAATPANATDMILRDSRDTTNVIIVITRVVVPGANPTFSFAGNTTALNGTVDIDTAFNVMQAGAAELVFLSSGTTNTAGRGLQ